MKNFKNFILVFAILSTSIVYGQEKDEKKVTSSDLTTLKFRSVGPALMSGRIADIAVNPNNYSEYYLGVASGGVWKTNNAGTTFKPIFDSQGSYSIGCVEIDPNNTQTIWVGSGENNNQRSVAYGDGVYKSIDAGESWQNMGLKNSEHIGMIAIDPNNSNTVYVAAYGPLWKEGGDRGLYKTIDGGKTWNKVLDIDKYTGVSEVHIDPTNPNVLYATAHQRMRHVFTYVGGGPGSSIFKSVDAGKTWYKITKGLPSGELGRIGMDISPANHNVLYAIIEANDGKGVYKSTNGGASWKKQNSYSTSGNYYQEVVCDPKDENTVYFMDTYLHKTVDGGKTIKTWGEKNKHVDNHFLWINPTDTKHQRLGTDGGMYNTFDGGKSWIYQANLPITQFYKVVVDNEKPFFYIYGGTQDNNSMGGPSRNTSANGIPNSDWFITNGGDGFESAVDPKNPNIVYAQSQYGYLVRYDKATGEKVGIRPQPQEGEKAFRWNWDAPLIISPHNNERLYFAANKLFRSDDRGNTWQRVSDDLTQQLDRNKMKVMGQVWSMDAIMKNMSTTIYGNIVALDESPLQENLIYVGTDDGLIQITEDAKTWRKVSKFKGIPENTYVNSVFASKHNANTVYASFNNHKRGDFKPYILKSTNKGKSWTSIASDLPERGSVYDVIEDPTNPDILFAGTEFGVFTTINGGKNWIQLKGGLPTIAVRDIEIQEKENSLVLATFGRGFYVLDDYSIIRDLAKNGKPATSKIFSTKKGLIFGQKNPLGGRGNSFQGDAYYAAKNPKQGVNFNFYLADDYKSIKAKRKEQEKKLTKEGKDISYPSFDDIRKEAREEKPNLIVQIFDTNNNEIKRIVKPYKKGYQTINWNGRIATLKIATKKANTNEGPWVVPGKYFVSLSKIQDGDVKLLVDKTEFEITSLYNQTIESNREETYAFQEKANKLYSTIRNTNEFYSQLEKRIEAVDKSVKLSPNADLAYLKTIHSLKAKLKDASVTLYGDSEIKKYQFEALPSINSRIGTVVWNQYYANVNITNTNKDSFKIIEKQLIPVINDLKNIDTELKTIEAYLKSIDAMPLPNQVP
jgi:photosystem II stability/assembly factor-like uncharacterized protein